MKNKLRKLWNIIKLNKSKALSLLRHIITALGAILIAKGIMDESVVEEVVGFIITTVGLLLSFNEKTN